VSKMIVDDVKEVAEEAEEELNQAVREIGVRFEGLTHDQQHLRFRVVDKVLDVSEKGLDKLAQEIITIVMEAPSPKIRDLALRTKGIVLE
jgi:hypothetical protein